MLLIGYRPQPPAPDGSVLNHELRMAVFPAGPQRQLRMAVFPAGPQPPAPVFPPDLSHQLRMAVFPAGPQSPAPDGSFPRLTSTASSGWQRSPPDLNREYSLPNLSRELRLAVFHASGWECPRRTSLASQKICQIEREKECEKICQIECQNELL